MKNFYSENSLHNGHLKRTESLSDDRHLCVERMIMQIWTSIFDLLLIVYFKEFFFKT